MSPIHTRTTSPMRKTLSALQFILVFFRYLHGISTTFCHRLIVLSIYAFSIGWLYILLHSVFSSAWLCRVVCGLQLEQHFVFCLVSDPQKERLAPSYSFHTPATSARNQCTQYSQPHCNIFQKGEEASCLFYGTVCGLQCIVCNNHPLTLLAIVLNDALMWNITGFISSCILSI